MGVAVFIDGDCGVELLAPKFPKLNVGAGVAPVDWVPKSPPALGWVEPNKPEPEAFAVSVGGGPAGVVEVAKLNLDGAGVVEPNGADVVAEGLFKLPNKPLPPEELPMGFVGVAPVCPKLNGEVELPGAARPGGLDPKPENKIGRAHV